ncbi:peptidoglycan-binding domain-containing protein [Streptomyces radicis]|uniref:Peptidoglycan-binding protein n=1 Tax=Streptomyces radicis TaxID=1750517 RepID=A0A3A9WIE8_9ACTN|nr:peptidoglycan-binding domain-containing protein [Streptomyces radicis]RKN12083.1 peptidoglycan-binding protein [Streptomyces radicis]RKN25865.1 peptidoglycan-binding protein [Streptomyces radicis]
MTGQPDCLVCGRAALPNGDPDCDCLTHSLSRPVNPPQHGPDPADVALFPLEPPPPRAARPGVPPSWPVPGSAPQFQPMLVEPSDAGVYGTFRAPGAHRKPRSRTRIAAAASGAVAAVMGCTALAASLLGGGPRTDEALERNENGPSLALPDGGSTSPDRDGDMERHGDEPREGRDAGGATDEPERPRGPTAPTPSPTPDPPPPPPAAEEPEPDPSEWQPTPPPPSPSDPPAEPSDPPDPPETPEPSDPDPDPSDPPPEEETPVLSAGDSGPEVAELQERLLQLGWAYTGEVTGVYDDRTVEAVRRFQSAVGVAGDPVGVYGANTRRALEERTTEP